jgi:hypothetical protein
MEYLGGDTYRLSTGRQFEANRGIIGLAPDFEVSEGYDGELSEVRGEHWDKAVRWTLTERVELADFMIAQWRAFRDLSDPFAPRCARCEALWNPSHDCQ